jgi:uncharacterized membrane protein YbhN (UPF0104 family)
VPQSQVPWSRCLAGFALARVLSAVPVTPVGVGIIEVGLAAYLSAGLDPGGVTRVTAAVLLARALTYVLPIVLGPVAYAGWRLRRPGARARESAE